VLSKLHLWYICGYWNFVIHSPHMTQEMYVLSVVYPLHFLHFTRSSLIPWAQSHSDLHICTTMSSGLTSTLFHSFLLVDIFKSSSSESGLLQTILHTLMEGGGGGIFCSLLSSLKWLHWHTISIILVDLQLDAQNSY
jgi:hypothetical protein